MKPEEIFVGAVHDVDGAGFGDQKVEHVDVMELAVGDVDKSRYRPLEVEQRMHFHRRLGRPEPCPGEHREAQVDGCCVQRLHGLLEHRRKTAVSGIQEACPMDQPLPEVGIDPPSLRSLASARVERRTGARNPLW